LTNLVKHSFSLTIDGGPSIDIDEEYNIEAYDRIDFSVPKAQSLTVDVQPSDAKDVSFIVIESDNYHQSDTEHLQYQIEGDPQGRTLILNRAQFLVGNPFVSLLGTAPKRFIFDNTLSKDANIKILTGRTTIQPTTPSPISKI
jgi:hypothetical protein